MVRLTTPEEIIRDAREAPPLSLHLACNRCGIEQALELDWACVNPRVEAEDAGWDGILLSRIVECATCGGTDDYTLGAQSRDALQRAAIRLLDSRKAPQGRIFVGVSLLWDGTVARRPSQALAHLRRLAQENPESAEAFRRLGNGCERWGLMDEAIDAWKKAVALDPEDIEAACSLLYRWWTEGECPEEVGALLRRVLRAVPGAVKRGSVTREWTAHFARILLDIVSGACGECSPVTLVAGWHGDPAGGDPVVHVSSANLAAVRDVERLAAFLAWPKLISVGLSDEVVEDDTQLATILSADDPEDATGAFAVSRATRVGRNAPCPCGSGKKHKRCCGR